MTGTFTTFRVQPLAALLRDELRRGWWKLAAAQTAALGTAAIVYETLPGAGLLESQAGRSLHLVLLWIVFTSSAAAVLSAAGNPARMFLLPVSNRWIAACALLPGMIGVGAIYLATVGLLDAGWGVRWPVWGPALFLAATLGVIKSLSLAVGANHFRRIVCWSLAAIFLVGWLCSRYGGSSFLEPSMLWQYVSLAEAIFLALLAGGAYLLGLVSIARTRRGDVAPLAAFTWRPAFAQRSPVFRQPFRDSRRAQFWFEWQQKGMILPATFIVFAALLLTGFFLKQFDRGTYELLHGCFGYGKGLAPIALLAGLVIGHLDPAGANPECGTFLATRPATNAALSAAILRASGAALLATWGMWCLAMVAGTVLLRFDQGLEPVLDLWTVHGKFSGALDNLGLWYAGVVFGIALLDAWVALSLAASLVLTGRQALLIGFVAGGVPVFLVMLFLAERANSGSASVLPAVVWQCLTGVAGLAGTAAVWAVALRRKQVEAETCGLALAGWLALCAVGAGIYFLIGPLEPAHLVMMAGMFALPFAAGAAAPLALAWNRHR
ncbi:MAG: hypothetical protein HY290_30210 [Planctomycetia bacterium]|nr:hypothetical protein [Planctomycetia bacterium]